MRKSACAGLGILLACGTMWSQTVISTVAGGGGPLTPVPAATVGLTQPAGAAVDASGNAYFTSGNCVFKVSRTGLLARVAGNGRAGYSGDKGLATAAQLSLPQSVAVDGGGNVYIADTGNNAVRKVTVDGVITTVANAFSSPQGVAVDAAGNLYVADTGSNVVREINAAGAVAIVAGNGTRGFSGDNGPATAAQLYSPEGLAVDGAGNLYIADSSNGAIRKVALNGVITTVAGVGGVLGYFGDGGPATVAQLNEPSGIGFDPSGNLYIADTANNAIRKVTGDGKIGTMAGGLGAGYSGDGGPAIAAQLWAPTGVAADAAGDVFIADHTNNAVREVNPAGNISTLAGNGTADYRGDNGPATSSQLVFAQGVAVDSSGNLYIADTYGHTIRKVTPGGTITTVAGTGVRGYSGDAGPATAAQLNGPQGVAVDSSGNIFIADTANHRVREVTTDGNIATVAGTGAPGYSANGVTAVDADLSSPTGVAVDSSGNLFIVDHANNSIREVTAGLISTVAGEFNAGYYGDGTAATGALLNSPTSVALDSAGDMFIADYFNNVIRKVTFSTGFISTIAGNGTPGYSGDSAAATSAQLFRPWGVWVDSSGNLFIGDGGNNVVREVNSSGTISTVAGSHVAGYSGDGGSAIAAELNGPAGVVVDSSGNLYIADGNNSAIRLVAAASRALPGVAVTHSGVFTPGQNGAVYSVVVSDAAGAGATSGAVTVTVIPSAGVTLASMSGSGWSCTGAACTRSDALSGGSSFPAIAVTVDVAATAYEAAIQVDVTTGGGPSASATDAAVVLGPPSAPALISPANGVVAASAAPSLTWSPESVATSYQVFFGTSSTPSQVASTDGNSYPTGPLSPGTTYYWQIVAQNATGSATSAVWSFTAGYSVAGLQFVPVTPCRVADTRNTAGPFGGPTLSAGATRLFGIPQSVCGIPATAQAYSLNVTAVPQGPLPYLTVWPAGPARPDVSTLNSQDGTVVANAAFVPAGANGAVSVYAAGSTDVVLDIDGYFEATGGAAFYAVTPCRVADTRNADGPLGGPTLAGAETRYFPVLSSACGIPSCAQAYSLNVTAVPQTDFLSYLTVWAGEGQPRPAVSTLNSWTGTVVANAAIVPAGADGSVAVFVTDEADAILDANGYFAAPGGQGALRFYPIEPCRVADTRGANGPFGGPIMAGGTTRTFAIPASGCYVPPAAAAYALNVTVVPDGPLSFLSAWPAGSARPLVSTLNSFDGLVTANAAIVPAGASGAIGVYVTNQTHVIVDIDGYFAP